MSSRRYTGPTRAVIDIVKERSNGRCEFPNCTAPATHTHHRKPRRSGGSRDPRLNLPSNLVRLCTYDHAWVESFRTGALEMGLLLHAGDDPAEVPVQTCHDPLPVLLLDDGFFERMDVAA